MIISRNQKVDPLTNNEEYPYVKSITYSLDENGKESVNNHFFNKNDEYYININIDKTVIIEEGTIIRLFFNNGTYVDKELNEKIAKKIIIKGDTSLYYTLDMKVIEMNVIKGSIKDENGNYLVIDIDEEFIDKESSISIVNKIPSFTVKSEKVYYTSNVATLIIETDEEIINSYCISENEVCDSYKEYEDSNITYEFDTDSTSKELCVYLKDKAGNVSSCSTVEFSYVKAPIVKFSSSNDSYKESAINYVMEVEESDVFSIEKYCLTIDSSECIKKDFKTKIEEQIEFYSEGIKNLKLILFGENGESFIYNNKLIYDITKPSLEVSISNEDVISNYKDILVNYSDNVLLNEDNEYEYYLSLSSTDLIGSKWTKFTNNKKFRIRNVEDGTYYLWIKNAKDSASNTFSNNEYFLVSDSLKFDNTNPTITIEYNKDAISSTNLVKEFIITYKENNLLETPILDASSIVINSTSEITYEITNITSIENGWIVEVTFDKETLKNGYFSLTILSNLVEDTAHNKNESIVSEFIKISS